MTVDDVLANLYQPDARVFILRPLGVVLAVAAALGRNPSPALGRVVRRGLQRMGGRRVLIRKPCWSGVRPRAVPREEALERAIGLRRWLKEHWPATRRIPFVPAAPLPPGTPALDTPGFQAVNRDWRHKLRESGFRDIEGEEHLDWGGQHVVHLGQMPAEVANAVTEAGIEIMTTRRSLDGHAAAFGDWRDLPPAARSFHVLLMNDWDIYTAAKHLGISKHRAYAWAREIRARLARRRFGG